MFNTDKGLTSKNYTHSILKLSIFLTIAKGFIIKTFKVKSTN